MRAGRWLGVVVAALVVGCGADSGGSGSSGATGDAGGGDASAVTDSSAGNGTDVGSTGSDTMGGDEDASTADTSAPSEDLAEPDAGAEEDTFEPPTPAYQTVDVQTLKQWLDTAPDDFVLINVHVPYAGEIPGTDEHIAYNDLALIMAALDGDKGRKAVLYCLTGPMSLKATKDLVAAGYYDVYDFPEAMVGWKAAGHPFTDP